MKKSYTLSGIECAVCANKIETMLNTLPSLQSAVYNHATQKLTVEYDDNLDHNEVFSQIKQTVLSKEPNAMLSDYKAVESKNQAFKEAIFSVNNIIRLIGVLALIAAAFVDKLELNHYLVFGIYMASYFLIGHTILWRFLKNSIKLQLFDENFLMTAATVGAIILGHYFEAVTILLFYQVGEFFQDLAVQRSRSSIRNLIDTKEYPVTKITKDNTALTVMPSDIDVGDIILIKSGEKIMLDGEVIKGSSTIDTSSITGESVPEHAEVGSLVLSGCINLENPITVRVTKKFQDSTAAKILDMIENASSNKAKSEQFMTRFSKIYTPSVVGVAFIIGVVIPLIMRMNAAAWSIWGKTALTFLLVSCPCALVLSIPISFFGGLGAASKYGILFKGANYLEALTKADTFIFDKTGTLTSGVFEVTDIEAQDMSADELLMYAAYAEHSSTHPLARAVIRKYGKDIDISLINNAQTISGQGVIATVGGKTVLAGSKKLLDSHNIDTPEIERKGSVIMIAIDNKYAGKITLADTVKQNAAQAIQDLKKLGIKKTIMITGDSEDAASEVKAKTGIDIVYARALPQDKLDIIEKYAQKENKTVFVGEGINDVLAISRADVGVAMGILGSDVSVEAADVVVMNDELDKLPIMLRLARRTRKIVILNIVLVLLVKFSVMVINFFPALQSLILAELADLGIALVAVFIARTIFRYNPTKDKKTKRKLNHKHNHN